MKRFFNVLKELGHQTRQTVPRPKLSSQIQALLALGWDEQAVQTLSRTSAQLVKQALTTVGSPGYTRLYLASRLPARQRLTCLLRQLEVSLDHHGFLHLGQPLAEDLPPHAAFYAAVRRDVLQVYVLDKFDFSDQLAQKLHLLRYYFDRQNIRYIREHFPGQTDFDKLLAYSTAFKVKLDYSTGANFHNRTRDSFAFPKNMKIQAPKHNTLKRQQLNNARMAEFILDMQTGAFVSEWDVYHIDGQGRYDSDPSHYPVVAGEAIANTASFNYGFSYGQNLDVPYKYRHSHQRLDVQHPRDHAVRRKMTRAWRFEPYVKHGGRYQDLVKKAGLRDLEQWQAVPETKRLVRYQAYSQGKASGKGFSRYVKKRRLSLPRQGKARDK